MVFLALLAHPDLQVNPLVEYQVVLELLEIRDYRVHQVMSMESFETNILSTKICPFTSRVICVKMYFLFTLSPLPFYQCCFILSFYHCTSLTIPPVPKRKFVLVCTSTLHHPKECALFLFCISVFVMCPLFLLSSLLLILHHHYLHPSSHPSIPILMWGHSLYRLPR